MPIDPKKITMLLKRHKTTPYQLAMCIEVVNSTIYRILNGQTPDPRLSVIEKIANALGVKVEELLY